MYNPWRSVNAPLSLSTLERSHQLTRTHIHSNSLELPNSPIPQLPDVCFSHRLSNWCQWYADRCELHGLHLLGAAFWYVAWPAFVCDSLFPSVVCGRVVDDQGLRLVLARAVVEDPSFLAQTSTPFCSLVSYYCLERSTLTRRIPPNHPLTHTSAYSTQVVSHWPTV